VFYRGVETPASFPSDFFVAVRLLKRREKLTEPDFALLARAFNRARALHPFYLTAWVFLPDHWHSIRAPVHPTTISLAMKLGRGAASPLLRTRSTGSGARKEKNPRTTEAVVRATSHGSPGSSTAPCAPSRNRTRRSSTST